MHLSKRLLYDIENIANLSEGLASFGYGKLYSRFVLYGQTWLVAKPMCYGIANTARYSGLAVYFRYGRTDNLWRRPSCDQRSYRTKKSMYDMQSNPLDNDWPVLHLHGKLHRCWAYQYIDWQCGNFRS
ncbi:MAG: hypothetical protein HN929_10195 [Chloroflexi bacterium]|nr:hypothetical protein [Chloroflexota bacterium]